MIKIINDNFKINKTFYLSKLKEVVRELKLKGNIVIKLGNKSKSKELNSKYLKRNYPTDVLSFPVNERLTDGFYIGDIFICYPIACEQAEENNISIKNELITLMVHGILHLAGYEHEKDSSEMLELQEKLVNRCFNDKGTNT